MSITNRDKSELGVPQNYIVNGGAESGLYGWTLYSNTASNIPITGIGGTATGLSLTYSTSSPLRFSSSLVLTQSNSTSVQGKGVSYAFTLSNADQSNVIAVSFDYNASSTFVASDGLTPPLNDGSTNYNTGNSDLEVFIYDITNSKIIYLNPQVIIGNGSNNFKFNSSFQASSNSTSYRLIIHAATSRANSTGWTFKFDSVFVGPKSITSNSTGVIAFAATSISNTSYSANTPIKFGTVTYDTHSAYSTSTGYYTVPVTGFYKMTIGACFLSSGGADVYVFKNGSQDTQVAQVTTLSVGVRGYGSIEIHANAGDTLYFGLVNNQTFGASDGNFCIEGLPENASGSDDLLVAMIADTTSTSLTSSNPVVVLTNKTLDTTNAYNTSTGVYTVPVSGVYQICGCIGSDSGTSRIFAGIFKNGSEIRRGSSAGTFLSTQGNQISNVSCSLQLVAGDQITLNGFSSTTVSPGTNVYNNLSIVRTSSSIFPNYPVTVNASYNNISQSFSGGGTQQIVYYLNKNFDTHNAYNTSTGVYTVPVSGVYNVSAAFQVNDATLNGNQNLNINIYKNGNQIYQIGQIYGNGAANFYQVWGTITINVVAGDQLVVYGSWGGSNSTSASGAPYNYFCITKVG